MNLIKFSGIKDERIIKGKRYIRTDKTIMAVKQYNSYVASGFNSYDMFIDKAYAKLTRGIDLKAENLVVFSEIISKGKTRTLYLTIYKRDKDYGKEKDCESK